MTAFRALAHRPFVLLWAGQTISRVGDHLYEVALAWWVLERIGSALAMSTVLALAYAPMLLFLLIGGVAVDRLPRARLMLAADTVRGAASKVKDSGMISHPGLSPLLIAAAETDGIPYQLEVLAGGSTDARAIQVSRAGVPATCLSIPSRHVHTPSQIVDQRDVEGAVRLLKGFLVQNQATFSAMVRCDS